MTTFQPPNPDDPDAATGRRRSPATAAKSPGVQRIEALSRALTPRDRVCIFASIFLVAYAYGLDGTLRYAYQPYATASWGQHSLFPAVNVLRSVIAAAAQPTSARIADVFGRVELICASVLFYVVGTAVEAAAGDLATFAGGSVLYQVGFTMILLLVEVVIADITSTRARLLFSYVPALPFVINDVGERRCIRGRPEGDGLEVGHRHVGCHLHRVCAAADCQSLGGDAAGEEDGILGRPQIVGRARGRR
jgi:MFS transporter, SIT family, siderophore-iron:H+ symporter